MYYKRVNPFWKLKIGNNAGILKKFINKSKGEISEETDRLFMQENNDYINRTFINKRKKYNNKKLRNNSMVYNCKKLRNDTNRLKNEKDNNKYLNNTKILKLIKLKKLLIKSNNKNMNSLNNSRYKINKNESFDKNTQYKNILTYRYKYNFNKDKANLINNQTMYLNNNHKKSNDIFNNNRRILITSLCVNKKQNKNINYNNNHNCFFNLKKTFRKTNKYFSEINDSLIDINKKISKKKCLKLYQSEGNSENEQKILNKIKKEKNLKKFGNSYEVLGPIKKDFVVSLRQVKINKENLDKKMVWMNRTTANLLSFGEVYSKMPDDLFYKERKRIVKDYVNYKQTANMEIKTDKKKTLSSAKNLEINMNKIENMILSYKKLILKYNDIKKRINIKV